MDLVLDLLQGAGLAAAIGIRPFLPVLLAGALASANLGLDFDGTSLAFLEAPGFLLGVVAAVAIFDRVARRLDDEARTALPVYAEGAALAAAGLSILFPPLALVIVAGLAVLLVRGRRRQEEKYAGLRILR